MLSPFAPVGSIHGKRWHSAWRSCWSKYFPIGVGCRSRHSAGDSGGGAVASVLWLRMKKAMKKVKFASRTSAAKRSGAPKDIDEYIARVPEPARSTLNKIRAV